MRFALAVLAAGAAASIAFWRLPNWIGITFWMVLAYFALAGLGAGFFAGRRSALAGLLAIYAGLLLYGVAGMVRDLSAPEGIGPLGVAFRLVQLALPVLPYAVVGAAFGALGGYLRGRTVRGWR